MKVEKNKGITLVALIITIILMLILVTVTAYTGISSYKQSKVTRFITEMQLLQAKVDELVKSDDIEELNKIGTDITTSEQENSINNAYNNQEVTTNDITKYRFIAKEDILDILDVEDAQNDIMVNFETREIVSLNGIEYDGETYYTQYKLPNGQTVITDYTSTERDVSFDIALNIDGINAEVTIDNIKITNGTLSYKEENDDYWNQITNYTESGEPLTINISKSGNYIFRLKDNTTDDSYDEQEVKIVLTNSPKTSIELQSYNYSGDSDTWAYVQNSDGTYYVWIPRFVYKTDSDTEETEIKFVKGNSNISTDSTYIDDEWTIHSKFTSDDGSELTGIWVSVESPNLTGLDMLDLLNDSSRTNIVEI